MKPLIVTALVFLALGTSQQSFAQAGLAQPVLKAGAAKVDVTPAENELPRNYDGILDHIYSRAIVIDNGATRCAHHRGRGRCARPDLAGRHQAA